jgi:tetratricopeptide (TPR) repeat protein
MEDLFELFAEVIRLRAQGEIMQAQQLFQQFDEQAIKLGVSPQHPIVHHILFEADTSSVEEMWKSTAKVIEESLEMYQAEDQIMNRLETLLSLGQIYIYLRQPSKASSCLEQARQLLAQIEQGGHLQTTPFSAWESTIIDVKRQQIENLDNQIVSL